MPITTERIRRGLYRLIGITCECGGELRVERCNAEGEPLSNDPEFRWETFCAKCKTCDPDGWRLLSECVANAHVLAAKEGA